MAVWSCDGVLIGVFWLIIAAESANSRVKWLSLITNVVLVGIALAQVLYIRSMLENSY